MLSLFHTSVKNISPFYTSAYISVIFGYHVECQKVVVDCTRKIKKHSYKKFYGR